MTSHEWSQVNIYIMIGLGIYHILTTDNFERYKNDGMYLPLHDDPNFDQHLVVPYENPPHTE
jgi:hypothetical protein